MTELDTSSLLMIAIFVVGYILITLEHAVRIDKATTALITGVLLWTVHFVSQGHECIVPQSCLAEHMSSISQIIFFLLGALAIVAIIETHNGFAIIANLIKIPSKRKLLWTISILTFFLSAILDNLTTTIVMITLLMGVLKKTRDRLTIGGAVVIAANAGGAWTPIGDVTTTMLWIGGQISSMSTIRDLFLPSIASMVVSIFILSFYLKGKFNSDEMHMVKTRLDSTGKFIFFLGAGTLMFVPIFKILTGLPPFMGTLLGLGVLWLVTDIMHNKHEGREHLRVPKILSKIEFSGLLFFLGILLAIDALDSAGILGKLAHWLDARFSNTTLIATLIGLASAVVDNVPLVSATMGMYSLGQFPIDHSFWQKIAFCAGTGGSILVIGSAAGVVYMGLEKVSFFWYFRNISLAAIVGYFVGIGTYLIFS